MKGEQICGRMTDGISFFCSHRHGNKGLIEGKRGSHKKMTRVRKADVESCSDRRDQREAQGEGTPSLAPEPRSKGDLQRPAAARSTSARRKQHDSPDGVPHVESVQRLRAVGAPPRQAHQCRQPVGDVHQLVVYGPGFVQQRAGDKSDSTDASFPQRPLPPSQWPVAAARQRLASVVCRTTEETNW